jgi:hypothetical protein
MAAPAFRPRANPVDREKTAGRSDSRSGLPSFIHRASSRRYWQVGRPCGSGTVQVRGVPSCVITSLAVAVPS